MSAQPVETMVEDEPTVACASSAAPPVPWHRRAIDFVVAALAFLARPFQRAREHLAARLDPLPLASFLPPPPLHRKGEIPEEQKAIALSCLETSNPREISLGIADPVRGCLTHIELRHSL